MDSFGDFVVAFRCLLCFGLVSGSKDVLVELLIYTKGLFLKEGVNTLERVLN